MRVPASEREVSQTWAERARPAAVPLAIWGCALALLGCVQACFGGRLLPVLVQSIAGAVVAVIALVLVVVTPVGKKSESTNLRALPDVSIATVIAAVSITAVLNGAAVGAWLIIGGGLGLIAALGLLGRELAEQRRARSSEPDRSAP